MTFTAVRRTRRWTAPSTGTGRGIPRRLLPAALALLPAFLLGCEESDVVCPEGAILTLSAIPTTLNGLTGTPRSTLSGRVTNPIGVSLPGQTVVFNTSEGALNPPALTPIETDDLGIATSDLVTFKTATVDARCGTATDTVTITVVQGDLSDILLNTLDSTLSSCTEMLTFTAQAVNTNGDPINGLTIRFELRDDTGVPGTQPDYSGDFNPRQGVGTDATNGQVVTTFTPDLDTCRAACLPGPSSSGSCRAAVVAIAETGLASDPVEIVDNVN